MRKSKSNKEILGIIPEDGTEVLMSCRFARPVPQSQRWIYGVPYWLGNTSALEKPKIILVIKEKALFLHH